VNAGFSIGPGARKLTAGLQSMITPNLSLAYQNTFEFKTLNMVQATTLRHNLTNDHTISLTAKRHASLIESKGNEMNCEHSLTFKDIRRFHCREDFFE
jgi:hypothetical protein